MQPNNASFASQNDLAPKNISFSEIGKGLYAYTAEGDPNTGVVIGENEVLIIDAQATPLMAQDVMARVREVTDKPIRHVVLSHYHAVRVLGASAYKERHSIIASEMAREMIVERGAQDMASEIGRFPRLFRGSETIPGLTWPTVTFKKEMSIWLGTREVRLSFIGRGHTAGDIIVHVPDENVVFSGDLVEYHSACYCGDAHLEEWPATLQRLKAMNAASLMPGRGDALVGQAKVNTAIEGTSAFLSALYTTAKTSVAKGLNLKETYQAVREKMDKPFGDYAIYEHCLPFNVSRAFDEASGITHPVIWTAKRDVEMWAGLR
jgi:glyoxylase-like metal-dependent hydrolase (beta-lactamase superfamily II)